MHETCDAKTRNGGTCKNAPMQNGRCRMHGGKAGRPATHGRYSSRIPAHIEELAETFKEGNPLDVMDELALQRALFTNYLSRFQNEAIKPTLADLDYLNGWLTEITRTVERIYKIRNSTALTAAEVAFIASRIPEVVAKYIQDRDQQNKFVDELFGITGTPPADALQLSATINRE